MKTCQSIRADSKAVPQATDFSLCYSSSRIQQIVPVLRSRAGQALALVSAEGKECSPVPGPGQEVLFERPSLLGTWSLHFRIAEGKATKGSSPNGRRLILEEPSVP